jgi:hypothetical protein
MDILTYMAYALLAVLAAVILAYFLAQWSFKLDKKDHKKWAMDYFKYTEEEYEEYERLRRLEQLERDKQRRQESLDALNYMRRVYGSKEDH